jgi:hypothetical protein
MPPWFTIGPEKDKKTLFISIIVVWALLSNEGPCTIQHDTQSKNLFFGIDAFAVYH